MATAAAEHIDDPGTHIPGEETPRDYDSEARELGWLPKEEFKGDPSRWTDAETFVRKGDEVMPLIKAQNKRLKREIEDMRKQIRQASAHFSASEERAYTRALADLTAKQEAAVESGDLAAHRAVKKEIDALSAEMPGKQPSQATAEEAREAWDDWRDTNAWYDRANLASAPEAEVNARLYADRMMEKHIEKTKDMPPAEFFDYIGGLVKEKYPLIGRKPAREKPPSDVAPATGARPSARGKGWADMEPEVRRKAEALAEKWVKSGLLKKKDDYLASYDWSQK